MLILLLVVEIVVSGLVLSAVTAAYVKSVVTPREWSSRRRVLEVNEFFWSPNVAIDQLGQIHIAYVDFQQDQVRICYARTNLADSQITTTVLVSPYSVSIVAPALALDQAGNAHLAWLDGRDDHTEIYYAKISGSPPSKIAERKLSSDSTDCGEPHIAVDLDGNVHVVWHSKKGEVTVTPIDYEIFYSKLDKNGNLVVPEKMILPSDGFYSAKPSIITDGKNRLHMTWIDNRNTEIRDFHEVFYKRLDTEGRTVSNETIIGRISKQVTVDHAPAAMVDREGGIAFVFIDRSPGRLFEIYAMKIDARGATVFDRVKLASSRVFSRTGLPSAALDNNDNICVVYADVRSDTAVEELRKDWLFEAIYGKWRFAPLNLKLRWHIFFSKVDPSGRLVVKDRPVERNHYSSSSPAISIDSRSFLHIVYLEDDREHYWFVHLDDTSKDLFLSVRDVWDQSEKMLEGLTLSLALVPFFVASNALFLFFLILLPILVWGLKRRLGQVNTVYHSPSALLALCVMLKYAALALGYDRVIQFYPVGVSQLVTGIIAAVLVRQGLKISKVKTESINLYIVVVAIWMILDTFYNLCLISPIAIDPLY